MSQELKSKTLWTFLFWLVFFSINAEAFASGASEALTKEATALRRAGRDAEAVKKFKMAYDMDPAPRSAGQLGLCLQALGRWSEADEKLAEAISATQDPWIRKNRDTLKESLEVVKTHVGRIEVIGEPAGALVTVNGQDIGPIPFPDAIPVNEGIVDVELSATGYQRAQRSLTISGGSYQRLVLRLIKTNAPTQAALNPRVSAGPNVSAEDLQQAESSSGWSKSKWLWAGVAVAVVGCVVAASLLLANDGRSPAYNDSGNL